MKKFLCVLLALLITFSFSGCSLASKQHSAIKEGLQTLSADFKLLEQVDLGNVKSQLKEQNSNNPEGTGSYTLKVNVPVISVIDDSEISVPVLEYDINTSLTDYTEKYSKEVESSLNKYFSKKKFEETNEFDLKATIIKNNENKLEVNFNTADINKIRNFLQVGISEKTKNIIKDDEGYKTLSTLQSFKSNLKSVIPDSQLLDKVVIEKFEKEENSDTYSVIFTSLDPEKVYQEAAQISYDSYKASGRTIYGPYNPTNAATSLSSSLTKAVSSSNVTIVKLNCQYDGTSITGAEMDTFKEKVATARKTQLDGLVEKVTNEFVIPTVAKPSTKVLSGKNSGISVTIKTSSDLPDRYVAFYKVSSSIEEKGSLILTAYIVSGKTLTVKLPVGKYKIIYGTGENWYGTNEAFGPNGSYSMYETVVEIKSNYVYTLTLYAVANGNLPSRSIPNPFGN